MSVTNIAVLENDIVFNNKLADTITDYQAGEDFERDKWGDMVRDAVNNACTTKDEWKARYMDAEREQAAERQFNGETIACTKNGTPIASKAFPKTWNTDKAIIGKALDEGVDLLDENGNAKPKTAIQEEYKEKAGNSKTDMEKILTVISTYGNIYTKLNDDERELARAAIAAINGV